ncbi:MAG TPA: inorganic phosphate transporter [Bacteroidales bacterium]|nr:inorganic phosphate transporter [Bacteroidales bacterium]HPS16369.1 inorganic phosphate transporter [Bacteroidales bacterium]
MFGLDTGLTVLLFVCILAVCIFEFINGFHDTANAVATVIYTHSLKPRIAVIWSGFWNFLGVYTGGIAVAMGIVNLLPTEALIDQNIYHGVAMILSLILTAVIWNLGTWYFGIPCSSSHTLIGSIFGVGIAYMLLPGTGHIALNWAKVEDVGLSLLISPVFGFGMALLLMFLLKYIFKKRSTIFQEPSSSKAPPLWIRSILVLTCTSVSFSHGSNDGQKGVGLLMIIFIGIIPAHFAVDMSKNPLVLKEQVVKIENIINKIDTLSLSSDSKSELSAIKKSMLSIEDKVIGLKEFDKKDKSNFNIRKNIITVSKKLDKLILKNPEVSKLNLSKAEIAIVSSSVKEMKTYTEYSPWWVILIISLSLGLGTMIGWKRIVITIGEKIGKTHLTYAQGASAEIIAASTIAVSTSFGLPVSTTHVLSSGIAGTMVSDSGLKNLQMKTIKNIGIAWLITLPVTIIVSGLLFILLRYIIA